MDREQVTCGVDGDTGDWGVHARVVQRERWIQGTAGIQSRDIAHLNGAVPGPGEIACDHHAIGLHQDGSDGRGAITVGTHLALKLRIKSSVEVESGDMTHLRTIDLGEAATSYHPSIGLLSKRQDRSQGAVDV